MNSTDLYDINSLKISRLTTNNYSTSFSMGVRLLQKPYRLPIYAIYGFVRVADEIVDTFHDHDKRKLQIGRASCRERVCVGV